MPLFPGHPPFQVLTYRSPQGICAAGDEPWGPGNDAKLGYISELLIGTAHSGAHIDALAHMTVGDEQRWHGGSARTDLGDFGPLKGGAEELFPIWTRGILFDVPRHRGVEFLGAGEPVTAADLDAITARTGVSLAARRCRPDSHRLHAALARSRAHAGKQRAGAGPQRGAVAPRARRDRHRQRHRDLRGAARGRPPQIRITPSRFTPSCSSSRAST